MPVHSLQVGNMAYLTRMGLWGPGTAFTNFETFLDSMKQRGVSFLEMLVGVWLCFMKLELRELYLPALNGKVPGWGGGGWTACEWSASTTRPSS